MASFVLGSSAALAAPAAPTRPTSTLARQGFVLPLRRQENGNTFVLGPRQGRKQQSSVRTNKHKIRKKRSCLEWRLEITRVYSRLLMLQDGVRKVSLHRECNADVYRRIGPVWKELGLDKCLKNKVTVDSEQFSNLLSLKFPMEGGETVAVPQKKRKATSKLIRDNESWRKLLIDMYAFLHRSKEIGFQKDTVKSYMRDILKLPASQFRRIFDVWKELKLQEDLEKNVSPTDSSLLDKIHDKYPISTLQRALVCTKTRNLSSGSNSYFNKAEEEMLCEIVAGLARMGFPLEKSNLQDLCNGIVRAEYGVNKECEGISMDTIERIYKHGSVHAKSNVNPIDPKRAAQADPQVLNAFFHQLQATVEMLHEINPDVWPEDRYANVPPSRIYNCDEQGPNPTKLRNPVLIPSDMLGAPRLFQNTREGDGKMQFHYSVANVVRADGVQSVPHEHVEGAPAPFIIISDAGSGDDLDDMEKFERDKALANQDESNTIKINEALLDGWFDRYEIGKKETLINKFGFQIRATPSGSMLKRTFFDFILHFISQLPHDQGPKGLGVYLFLDWHSSRECPQSLLTSLLKYNVCIFVLPSKTSIWSQPCDCGKNELTAQAISKAAHDQGMLSNQALDYFDANKIFRAGLEKNCLDQNEELRRTGTNAVVSSFKKTGLYPMNYDNEGWANALKTFGKLNELMKKQRQDVTESRIPEKMWIVKPKPICDREPLTDEDEKLIKGFLKNEDFLRTMVRENGDPINEVDIPLLLLAAAIAEHLLGTYLQDKNRDISQPPEPKEPIHVAALKQVMFVGVTKEDRVDTTCTLSAEQISYDKLRTKLSLLPFGNSIELKKKGSKSSTAAVNITKKAENRYIRLDGERRQSRNFEILSTTDILEAYAEETPTDYDNKCNKKNLTAKERLKLRKKHRIARKTKNEEMSQEAIQIADVNRKKRNIDTIKKAMEDQIAPSFLSKLEQLLQANGKNMDFFHDLWDRTLLEPYAEKIVIQNEDSEKEFDVTRVGTDVSAVSHNVSLVFVELFKKIQGENANKKIKRRRRRGAGQATHLGKPGWVAGILIQRGLQMAEMKALEKTQKTLQDDITKNRSLIIKATQLKEELPDSYWKYDQLKGWKRTALGKLFEVYKSGMKAGDLEAALQPLNISQESFDAKVKELEESIAVKEARIPGLTAEVREKVDFLEATAEHETNNVGDRNEVDDDDDDDDNDEDDMEN